jgi:predicted transcriptional regulator of viral defense system
MRSIHFVLYFDNAFRYTATCVTRFLGEINMAEYTRSQGGKTSRSRERLGKLLREGGEVLTVRHAARILGGTTDDVAKTLARWCNQGWLSRIKRGVYVPVPVEALTTDRAMEDAWVLVPELFGPAYVGGWTAAEHWDLTEQIFRDICVFSARPIAKRHTVMHNIPFVVTHAPLESHFGTKTIWKNETKLLVSDPTKTIVDMLSNPWTGGGIQHVTDCLREFLKSSHFNADRLAEYAEKLGNGAVFKRLGFLAEQILGESHPLTAACKSRLSKGNAQLDPSLKGDRLMTRWRLFVPTPLPIDMGTTE